MKEVGLPSKRAELLKGSMAVKIILLVQPHRAHHCSPKSHLRLSGPNAKSAIIYLISAWNSYACMNIDI